MVLDGTFNTTSPSHTKASMIRNDSVTEGGEDVIILAKSSYFKRR